jgi:hypothetical protein
MQNDTMQITDIVPNVERALESAAAAWYNALNGNRIGKGGLPYWHELLPAERAMRVIAMRAAIEKYNAALFYGNVVQTTALDISVAPDESGKMLDAKDSHFSHGHQV